jgi:hypothetical protein
MLDLPERIWAAARVKMTDGTWYGDWHSNQTDMFSEYIKIDKFTDRESLREALLGGSMPMIASKMSKSGETEAVEYIPLERVLDEILHMIGGSGE